MEETIPAYLDDIGHLRDLNGQFLERISKLGEENARLGEENKKLRDRLLRLEEQLNTDSKKGCSANSIGHAHAHARGHE